MLRLDYTRIGVRFGNIYGSEEDEPKNYQELLGCFDFGGVTQRSIERLRCHRLHTQQIPFAGEFGHCLLSAVFA